MYTLYIDLYTFTFCGILSEWKLYDLLHAAAYECLLPHFPFFFVSYLPKKSHREQFFVSKPPTCSEQKLCSRQYCEQRFWLCSCYPMLLVVAREQRKCCSRTSIPKLRCRCGAGATSLRSDHWRLVALLLMLLWPLTRPTAPTPHHILAGSQKK